MWCTVILGNNPDHNTTVNGPRYCCQQLGDHFSHTLIAALHELNTWLLWSLTEGGLKKIGHKIWGTRTTVHETDCFVVCRSKLDVTSAEIFQWYFGLVNFMMQYNPKISHILPLWTCYIMKRLRKAFSDDSSVSRSHPMHMRFPL